MINPNYPKATALVLVLAASLAAGMQSQTPAPAQTPTASPNPESAPETPPAAEKPAPEQPDMTPDEADSLIGLYLHLGQVTEADELIREYYDEGEQSRTVVSYALEGQIALLRVKLGKLSMLSRHRDPAKLLEDQLKVLGHGVYQVGKGLELLQTRQGENRDLVSVDPATPIADNPTERPSTQPTIRGTRFRQLMTRLLLVRGRLQIAMGDASFRIYGSSPVRQATGAVKALNAKVEYERAKNDLHLAQMIRPSGGAFDVQTVASRLEERLGWLRQGLPFGGHTYFQHHQSMLGGDRDSWAVRPRLDQLLGMKGELDQFYEQRLHRLETASSAMGNYLNRVADSKQRAEYRRDREVQQIQKDLSALVLSNAAGLQDGAQGVNDAATAAVRSLYTNQLLEQANETKRREIEARMSDHRKELEDVMAQLTDIGSESELEQESGDTKLSRQLGQVAEQLARYGDKASRLKNLQARYVGGELQKYGSKLKGLEAELRWAEAGWNKARLSADVAMTKSKGHVQAKKSRVDKYRKEHLLRDLQEAKDATQDELANISSRAAENLKAIAEETWTARKEAAEAKLDGLTKAVDNLKNHLNGSVANVKALVEDFQKANAAITGYGAMIKGTGVTTISNLPDALMKLVELGLELKTLEGQAEDKIRKIKSSIGDAQSELKTFKSELEKLDLEKARDFVEGELKAIERELKSGLRAKLKGTGGDLTAAYDKLFANDVATIELLTAEGKQLHGVALAAVAEQRAIWDAKEQDFLRARQTAEDLRGRAKDLVQAIERDVEEIARHQSGIAAFNQDLEDAKKQAESTSEQTKQAYETKRTTIQNQITVLERRLVAVSEGKLDIPVVASMEVNAIAQGRSVLSMADDYEDRLAEANQLWLAYTTWLYRITGDPVCMEWCLVASDHFQLRNAIYYLDKKVFWPVMRNLGTTMPKFATLEFNLDNLPGGKGDELGASVVELADYQGRWIANGSRKGVTDTYKYPSSAQGASGQLAGTEGSSAVNPAPTEHQIFFEISTQSDRIYAGGKPSKLSIPSRSWAGEDFSKMKALAKASLPPPPNNYFPVPDRDQLLFGVTELSQTRSGGFLWDLWVYAELLDPNDRLRGWIGIEPIGPVGVRFDGRIERLPAYPSVFPDHAAKSMEEEAPLRQYRILRETLSRDQFHTFGRPVPGHNYPEYMGLGLDSYFRLRFSDASDLARVKKIQISVGYLVPGQNESEFRSDTLVKEKPRVGANSVEDLLDEYASDSEYSANEALELSEFDSLRKELWQLSEGSGSNSGTGVNYTDARGTAISKLKKAGLGLETKAEAAKKLAEYFEEDLDSMEAELKKLNSLLVDVGAAQEKPRELAEFVTAYAQLYKKQKDWFDQAMEYKDAKDGAKLNDGEYEKIMEILKTSQGYHSEEKLYLRLVQSKPKSLAYKRLYLEWLTATSNNLLGITIETEPEGGGQTSNTTSEESGL